MADIYGKGPRGKATRLHAEIVRARGACERCGSTQTLQCAHIYSRRYSNTRTDLANALALCAKDHFYFTANPMEFAEFCLEYLGAEHMTALQERKNANRHWTKRDWEDEAARLLEIAKSLEDA